MRYNYKITQFQMWLLERICRKIVIQSREHKNNITTYYRIMYNAAKAEFREDNLPTLVGFLTECFKDSHPHGWWEKEVK